MQHIRINVVFNWCRSILTLVISMSSFISNGSFAQQSTQSTDAVADTLLEEVIVTGSYIKSKKFENRAPVDVLDRAALEKSSTNQLRDVLKDIPANTGSVFSNESQLLAGTGAFNVRGLGLASTLTLINGRRGGVAPVSDDGGGDFFDVNSLPVSAVQRIEVLKDGASATYGSEAVSGVANIITRKGFEGFELSADYENANTNVYSVNLAVGKNFGEATFNLYGTYFHEERANRIDLDFINKRTNGNGIDGRSRLTSATGAPGTYFPLIFNANGDPINLAGGAGFADPDCEAAGGSFRINDDGTINTDICRHSFFEQQSTIPESNRLNVFAEYELPISNKVTYYGETSYARNEFLEDNGPLPTANGAVEGGRLFVPGDHPFNFFIQDPNDPLALQYIDPSVWDNSIHTAVPVAAQARPLGRAFNNTGIDKQDQRREFLYNRIVNGLDIELNDSWQFTISHMFASSNFTGSIPLTWRSDIINQLLVDGGYNPFGTSVANPSLISPKDGVSVAANDQSIIDQMVTVANRDIRSTQHVIDVLFTGELGDYFGTGNLGTALGVQYRELELTDNPDSLISSGEGRVTSTSNPLNGEQEVYSLFAEVLVPFNDLAELQFALRFEDYGDFGDSVDPKIAGSIHATNSLTLRGSWGTAFQAPTIRQTAEQVGQEFIDDAAVNGICGPGGESLGTVVRSLGNDNLEAQSSTSYTLGIIFQPESADFNMSVDYWNFDYDDLIAPGLSGQTIVNNDCADDGIANDPRVQRDGSGNLQEVFTSFGNVGRVVSDGVDFAFTYNFPTDNLGLFTVRSDVAYVNKFEVTDGSGVTEDFAGSRNISTSFNTLPKLRGIVGLDWAKGIHDVNMTVRYTDSYENDSSGSNNAEIDSFTTVGLQYGVDLSNLLGDSSNTRLTLGIENVFDEDPPALVRDDANGNRISGTINDIDRPGYDERSGASLRGRVAYIRATMGF